MNTGTLLSQAQVDRDVLGALTRFVEARQQSVSAVMAELSSQVVVGLSGPFKYIPNKPDRNGTDERAETMRNLVNEQIADIDRCFLTLVQQLEEFAHEIPDDDTIIDENDDRERESNRTFRSAAE